MDRLDKFLAECGAGSRTQVKGILKAGRVTVDGLPERDPSRKIDPQTQEIRLDGGILAGRRRVVAMLNKPAGFVTATEDKTERTVMELLPPEMLRQSPSDIYSLYAGFPAALMIRYARIKVNPCGLFRSAQHRPVYKCYGITVEIDCASVCKA